MEINIDMSGKSMVCGIIGNHLYAQHGNEMRQLPISWSNLQTVPVPNRGRRTYKVAQVPTRASEDVSESSAATVMWVTDGVAVVFAILVVTLVASKSRARTKAEDSDAPSINFSA